MISHKYYSNPHVLMMRLKASKNSSRGFQVSSEINFLISVRKTLPTSGQTVDVTHKFFYLGPKRPLTREEARGIHGLFFDPVSVVGFKALIPIDVRRRCVHHLFSHVNGDHPHLVDMSKLAEKEVHYTQGRRQHWV